MSRADQASRPEPSQGVSLLLGRIRGGDEQAWELLVQAVYPQLHALAHREMGAERADHVLQTTALVNEAWMKLVGDPSERIESRLQFFAAAARAMRRILVDEARRRNALRRGGGARRLSLSGPWELEALPSAEADACDEIELLHRALETFERRADRRDKSRVVELRFFAGLSNEQVAELTGVSLATVKRDWEFARAWLRREMERMSA